MGVVSIVLGIIGLIVFCTTVFLILAIYRDSYTETPEEEEARLANDKKKN